MFCSISMRMKRRLPPSAALIFMTLHLAGRAGARERVKYEAARKVIGRSRESQEHDSIGVTVFGQLSEHPCLLTR